ncbi:S-layer homology domain-containing protein [Oscillibacter sp.]|uniref:S-layer homology domain-containing protein n=1 Tax=Oscillibacter sp. TaxID=1945593 RepID=UPI001B47125B|nr:S-layer homology domain-containing protein [Oscillibacter sp.]MBP3508540.1 S-layer homology domain-containing protein [Oscillibacter sp.]
MIKKQLQRLLSCLALCAILAGGLTAPAAAAGFTDVPAGHPAAEDIRRCVELGFFQGESATRFGLGHPMTRAAFAVVLGRFFGWETAKPTQATYTDVPVSAWYAGAVQAAYAHGAVTAQRAEFRPNDPITREELAVMLVRALGYGTIAGLAQDLPSAFQDVTTNAGYITMVCDLGLMDGVSATSFAPSLTAPREELAVILMRLYDKLHRTEPGKVGILSPGETLPDLTGCEAVAVSGAHLLTAGGAKVTQSTDSARAAALRDAAHAAGAKALLYVEGGPTALNGTAAETAACLVSAVEAGGYDGILLDIPSLKLAKETALVKLTQVLKSALSGKLLYLVAEAPSWQGTRYDGYNYAALGKTVDKLILRIASYEKADGQYPAAPVEPLEELYYALAELQGKVDSPKLSILMSAKTSVWVSGKKNASLTTEELAELTAKGSLEQHYSDRYGCAYLSGFTADKKPLIAWYLDQQSVEDRARLAGLFDVQQLVIDDLRQLPAAQEQAAQ